MTRKSRNISDLKRRVPFRIPRLCVLIVCEGEKTEPDYFKSLRRELNLSSVEVKVVGKECGSAPINVVDAAIERKSQSATHVEYDEIWCVMDVEAPKPHKTLADAVVKARDNDVNVALSNPCFEYWYILHFEKTSQFMQKNNDVTKVLKRHYPKYRKNDPGIFDVIFPNTEKAIKHAKEVIKEKHLNDNPQKDNPSTHVHLVVEKLQDMATLPSNTTW